MQYNARKVVFAAVIITALSSLGEIEFSVTARQSHHFLKFTLITRRFVKLPGIRMYLVRSTLPKMCLKFLSPT
jgi:hypothetical protein